MVRTLQQIKARRAKARWLLKRRKHRMIKRFYSWPKPVQNPHINAYGKHKNFWRQKQPPTKFQKRIRGTSWNKNLFRKGKLKPIVSSRNASGRFIDPVTKKWIQYNYNPTSRYTIFQDEL